MLLDPVDWKILSLLQLDARMSNVQLAHAVGLSPSPCLARVRTLEQAGFISRYVTLLDALKVGLKVSVFIQVALERQVEKALEIFENNSPPACSLIIAIALPVAASAIEESTPSLSVSCLMSSSI